MYSAQISKVEWQEESLLATVAFKDDDNKHPSFNRRIDVTGLTVNQVKGKLANACRHYENNGDLLIELKQLIDLGTLIMPAAEDVAAGEPAASAAPAAPSEPPANSEEHHDL